mmetsp:Transcript_9159/g.16045  ORF Transcript_9159/g.16045 Transcript_9159/m.16045 type:complete len:109 (-) Transcript_9159:815-1141(-)
MAVEIAAAAVVTVALGGSCLVAALHDHKASMHHSITRVGVLVGVQMADVVAMETLATEPMAATEMGVSQAVAREAVEEVAEEAGAATGQLGAGVVVTGTRLRQVVKGR